ncbi:MAG: hypothetical protein KAQ90_08660 [Melioribacteraceae bacterium]|nr:hypothetical protein [Melioribacteraceae bacterium]
MKQTLTILLMLVAGIVFYSCNDDDPVGNNSVSQIMFIYAEHNDSYWDQENEEYVYEENTRAWGVVFGDPFPAFIHFKLGETIFSDDEYSEIYPGYIGIGLDTEEPMITSNLNPLDVEVKTSLGQVNGTVFLPDTMRTLTLSEYDNLQLGESFTVSWSGSNAEFYQVSLNYRWVDENDNSHYEYLGEFVSGNSITYPGSNFLHNGEISYISVQPINGPIPEEGTPGNMDGDGSGFLYYIGEYLNYEGDDIIVGSGTPPGMSKNPFNEIDEKVIRERLREEIQNRILGNQ